MYNTDRYICLRSIKKVVRKKHSFWKFYRFRATGLLAVPASAKIRERAMRKSNNNWNIMVDLGNTKSFYLKPLRSLALKIRKGTVTLASKWDLSYIQCAADTSVCESWRLIQSQPYSFMATVMIPLQRSISHIHTKKSNQTLSLFMMIHDNFAIEMIKNLFYILFIFNFLYISFYNHLHKKCIWIFCLLKRILFWQKTRLSKYKVCIKSQRLLPPKNCWSCEVCRPGKLVDWLNAEQFCNWSRFSSLFRVIFPFLKANRIWDLW